MHGGPARGEEWIRRDLTQAEQWVSAYEGLVDRIAEGYEDNIYEYTNDLACRLFIQRALEKKDADLVPLTGRVDKADARLRAVLLQTKACIHGEHPRHYFWLWGIPENSQELRDDAASMGWL